MAQSHGSPKKEFDLGKLIVAKRVKGKNTFEMIADPDEAWKAKKLVQDIRNRKEKEEPLSVADVIKNPEIDLFSIFQTFDLFQSVRKGDRYTNQEIEEAFGTLDGKTIAADFILEGEFAWTAEQRSQWLEKKRKQIVTILARNCINPQTKNPHPPNRIEKALEEAHVAIDINKTAEEQIEAILKQIQTVIPIRMESIQMAIKVPANYAAKAYNVIEKLAQITKSEWQTDGSWIGIVSLPAGLQMELLDKLNNLTHGRIQSKLL